MAEVPESLGAENPDVRHEPRDVRPWVVVALGASVVALAVIVQVGLWGLLRYYDAREKQRTESDLPPAVSERERVSQLPPAERFSRRLGNQPPLEGLELDQPSGSNRGRAGDVRAQAAAERERLQSYGWVDRDKGVVHVPLARAAQIALEQRDKYLRARPPEGKNP